MHIAIIGKGFKSLNEYLENNKHSYVIFRDIDSAPEKTKDNTVYVSFNDYSDVVKAAILEHENVPFDAILTIYEQYIVITSKLAHELGLPGLPLEAALACTDKTIMRSKFAEAPRKISPAFMKVTNRDSLIDFASNHDFPLMLKPANLAKSLLVTKSNNLEELLENYDHMIERIDEVYKKYAPRNERIILVEEFLEGSIHSVDAFVDTEGHVEVLPFIVDYQTGYDIGYDDNFHYSRLMPSTLNEQEQADFLEVAQIAVQSLGMKSSAAHIEIIMTKQGPRVVEIGARNGGYRERMHRLSQGIDIYGNLLATLANQPINLTPTANKPSALLELFPYSAGTFEGIQNLEQLEELPSLVSVSVKYREGDRCGKSSDGYKAACVIFLNNDNQNQFYKDLNFITESVKVITKN